MTDHITHERNRLFGPETCQMGDPCFFRQSPSRHEQHGRVVGMALCATLTFNVEDDQGVRHNNAAGVRLDHEAVRATSQAALLKEEFAQGLYMGDITNGHWKYDEEMRAVYSGGDMEAVVAARAVLAKAEGN